MKGVRCRVCVPANYANGLISFCLCVCARARVCQIHLETGYEGQEGEQRYSSALSLTSALDLGWVVNATPRPLYHRERPGTHCTGGWVGPRSGLDG
jgi:hypothetical protein